MKTSSLDTLTRPLWSVLVQVDGKHRNSGATFERLHVDIEHLDLSKGPRVDRGVLG